MERSEILMIERSTKAIFTKTKNYVHDLDINKILVSKKELYGTKNSLNWI